MAAQYRRPSPRVRYEDLPDAELAALARTRGLDSTLERRALTQALYRTAPARYTLSYLETIDPAYLKNVLRQEGLLPMSNQRLKKKDLIALYVEAHPDANVKQFVREETQEGTPLTLETYLQLISSMEDPEQRFAIAKLAGQLRHLFADEGFATDYNLYFKSYVEQAVVHRNDEARLDQILFDLKRLGQEYFALPDRSLARPGPRDLTIIIFPPTPDDIRAMSNATVNVYLALRGLILPGGKFVKNPPPHREVLIMTGSDAYGILRKVGSNILEDWAKERGYSRYTDLFDPEIIGHYYLLIPNRFKIKDVPIERLSSLL